jgi:APA family basic amino acid/polyamine antiporter
MQKKLKLWDAIMLVMGSMIGSGIFIVAADMMRNLGSGFWVIVVWIITGIMTVAAAISYGELSAMFPKAGGQYTYLKEIFGKNGLFVRLGIVYGHSNRNNCCRCHGFREIYGLSRSRFK